MLTERIEKIRQNYVNSKPAISTERAYIWTNSEKKNEGKSVAIRSAQAFYDTCNELSVHIFEGELIVGAIGEHRKCGILTPDYQDVLFKKGFGGIIKEAKQNMAALDETNPEDMEKKEFYESIILTSKGIIRYANRYAAVAERQGRELLGENRNHFLTQEKKTESQRTQNMEEENHEEDVIRGKELLEIAAICRKVPECPPESFREAIQFVWFTQIGGILSENPLSLNPGRFDQYMYPYYKKDLDAGLITKEETQELIEALWLKYSEWVWTISANTADYFAGYNQFQNLTVGGRTREGLDATNDITYMCMNATAEAKTHQPGLSVRVHADCPNEFLGAVTELVSKGTGFPAIHNDSVGYQMLINAGYEPEDARDWNNCGCVVPHFRKTGEWTAAVNVNFGCALEYTLNEGKSQMTGKKMGLKVKPAAEFTSYEEVEDAFFSQFDNLCKHSIILTLVAQRIHAEMVPRPFLSSCIEACMDNGKDLSHGGAKYNIGPVITGIGLAVVANSLAVIKKLVFEEKKVTIGELAKAVNANWEGYDDLRNMAIEVPKYGNDDNYVDEIAIKIANHYYREIHQYKDIFGSPFNTAFMGISNYIPMGRVLGATPCGRKAGEPSSEGVSPYVGTDKSTPLAAMRSAAKVNQEIHSGGTLLNLRLNHDLVATKRGQANLGAMIQSFFSLGAFHVQFNTVSSKILKDAQQNPQNYKDLLVRVAGYSTQFVNLSHSMQDAIIARTEHAEM